MAGAGAAGIRLAARRLVGGKSEVHVDGQSRPPLPTVEPPRGLATPKSFLFLIDRSPGFVSRWIVAPRPGETGRMPRRSRSNGSASHTANQAKYDAQNTVLDKTYGALADLRRELADTKSAIAERSDLLRVFAECADSQRAWLLLEDYFAKLSLARKDFPAQDWWPRLLAARGQARLEELAWLFLRTQRPLPSELLPCANLERMVQTEQAEEEHRFIRDLEEWMFPPKPFHLDSPPRGRARLLFGEPERDGSRPAPPACPPQRLPPAHRRPSQDPRRCGRTHHPRPPTNRSSFPRPTGSSSCGWPRSIRTGWPPPRPNSPWKASNSCAGSRAGATPGGWRPENGPNPSGSPVKSRTSSPTWKRKTTISPSPTGFPSPATARSRSDQFQFFAGQPSLLLLENTFYLLRNAPRAAVLGAWVRRRSVPVRKLSHRFLAQLRKANSHPGASWERVCIAHPGQAALRFRAGRRDRPPAPPRRQRTRPEPLAVERPRVAEDRRRTPRGRQTRVPGRSPPRARHLLAAAPRLVHPGTRASGSATPRRAS